MTRARKKSQQPEVALSVTLDAREVASSAGEVFVVVGSADVSNFDAATESYCVRAYRSGRAAEDHARRAGEVSAQAQAYERPPGTDGDYMTLVCAAFPALRELDPEWRRGVETATTYRVERVRLD